MLPLSRSNNIKFEFEIDKKSGLDGKTVDKISYDKLESEIKKIAKIKLEVDVEKIKWNKEFRQVNRNMVMDFDYYFKRNVGGGRVEFSIDSKGIDIKVLV